jgi:hypothetical protein
LAAFGLTAVWNFAILFSAQTIGTRRFVKGVTVFEGKTSRDVGVESIPEMLNEKLKQLVQTKTFIGMKY